MLAEYQDPDTMQVHSIWIPIANLYFLETPLTPKAVGYPKQDLMNNFNHDAKTVITSYAR